MNSLIRRAISLLCVAPLTLGLMLLPTTSSWAQEKGGDLKKQLVGTWALQTQVVEQGDGKKVERFGSKPKGIAIFVSNGQMAQVLLRPDLPKFASNNAMTGTPEENKAIVQGSTAYFGTWSVTKDGTISRRITGSTFPNWDGQDQTQIVTIKGDEMKSCIPGAAQIGGTACTTWKRIK
jgi:hypothetical protein